MPTPFMHLDYAQRIAQHHTILDGTLAQLNAEWPAFNLGNIAADYQSLCDIPRELTHFYPVPLPEEHDALDTLLSAHPCLRQVKTLSAETAVFIAGYLAHLHFDLVWYRRIMLPYFVFNPLFEGIGRRERFTVHNILLTYLDQAALAALPDSAESALANAISPTTLPFIVPHQLDLFRDQVAQQLLPGAPIITVQLYADRMGISAAEFGNHLIDPQWMQTEVFDRIVLDEILSILDNTIGECVDIINNYLIC